MIDPGAKVPVTRKAKLLALSRSTERSRIGACV